ncbi:hypothetical protein IFM89_002940 [Coptis chinensis]|uniref:RING-type domain-containing protein n=1 Tax=Coptis chinensis TaxID=261450 RepID=A0A835IJC1_9MAGN|nr:hypothetical protein IFM89_002940 [Coptis chinensis]
MSISPTHAHRSKSSNSTPSSNPINSNHGFLFQSSPQPQQLIPSDPTTPLVSDGTLSSAPYSIHSSKKVTRPNGRRNTRYRYQSDGHGMTSSHVRNDQVGAPPRKNQTGNANHLLNFQYDPILRPQPRVPPPRRPQKMRPYNKDLFLQANFRFVVLDSGTHSVESTDADKMLQWENVVCVRYSTPYPVQCPICLETPLCPQITSCGHIFCFPCILRYLLMGENDHKGDCWKKCPLCFVPISLKDLYTIYIEDVKHYQLGDDIQFTLLTREKHSLVPSQKDSDNLDFPDSFSKFSLTSDVDLSVGEAYSELKDWLVRAESGLVDDLQHIPYVCAALEQLEQRKKFWTEMRSLIGSPPLGNSTASFSNSKALKYSCNTDYKVSSSSLNEYVTPCATPAIGRSKKSKQLENSSPENVNGEERVGETGELLETCEGKEFFLSSSYEEENIVERHANGPGHIKEKDSYSFYQAVDGQHLIIHPLNMKCLLHHYGSSELLPHRISGKILELETLTQTEAVRRRYRFLSHFSLTTTFQLCEIDMSEILPSDALLPFKDEIKKRENQRKRLKKKEHQEQVKAEVTSMHAMSIQSNFGRPYIEKSFSMDDFKALGNAPLSSSPPMSSERKRFSDVTRLGFAAAHDSPSLKAEESADSSKAEESGETSGLAGNPGRRNMVTLSFANIISTTKSPESREIPKIDALVGKKGKKPNRVLLSTAGGRRY